MQGIYNDINASWFSDFGSVIVFSYIIIIIIPPIEFAAKLGLRYLLRVYDQKKCCCPKNLPTETRKKSMSAYKDLYEGPEFDIDY